MTKLTLTGMQPRRKTVWAAIGVTLHNRLYPVSILVHFALTRVIYNVADRFMSMFDIESLLAGIIPANLKNRIVHSALTI